jgi:hypothetical protein
VATAKSLKVALCIVFLLFASSCAASHCEVTSPQAAPVSANSIRLVIDYGNSTQRIFSNLSGLTAFDVLNETATVAYIMYAFGRFVQSINGVQNNAGGNGYYWQYWVNDQLAPVAADYYRLSDGDNVLWKYCAPGQTGSGLLQGMPDWWIGLFIIVGMGCVLVTATVLLTRRSRRKP